MPPIPANAWRRLPEDDDGLIEIAREYYAAPQLLPVAGSQAAIQALPRLRAASRVGVIAPGYAEHAHAWREAGHTVETLPAGELLASASRFDVIVLIHPNNPGGDVFTRDSLLQLHAQLAARGGWLIVDEAFIDASPGHSLAGCSDRDGLIVLRSVGKFFGLAGARAGFVCAAPALLTALRKRSGPWTLTGPARDVLKLALADRDWQRQQRERLHSAGIDWLRCWVSTDWHRARAARLPVAMRSARRRVARSAGPSRHPHSAVRGARQPAFRPARR